MDRFDTFGNRLERAMKARRIHKVYILSSAMGVDESAISRWRRNKPISTVNLVKLCAVLQISVDWLLTGAGDMNGHNRPAERSWQEGFAQEMLVMGVGNPAVLVEMFEKLAKAAEAIRPA